MKFFWSGFYKKAELLSDHVLADADGAPPLFRSNGVGVSYDQKPDQARTKDDDKYEKGDAPGADVFYPSSGLGAAY